MFELKWCGSCIHIFEKFYRTKHLSDDWMLARNFVEPELAADREVKWVIYQTMLISAMYVILVTVNIRLQVIMPLLCSLVIVR